MEWFKFVPCHRLPSRSLFINGKQLPLCTRCLAILFGYIHVPLFLAISFRMPIYIGLLLQVPMLLDGLTQHWRWRTSTNGLRAITGLLSGMGQSGIVVTLAYFLVEDVFGL